MSKLDEFNANLESLQKEVENLQAIEQAYKQLAKLAKDYDVVVANLNTATKDLASAKEEMQKQTSFVGEKLNEQRKELDSKLKSIQSLLEEKLKEFQNLLETKADEINSANKKFYNEFAETVKTRLDNNKMEIKQLIDEDSRSTHQQLEELKKEHDKQISNLAVRMSDAREAIEKQLLAQKKISLAFGIVIVVLLLTAIVLPFLVK